MKKLALLMFAILILGCGTETTVVEERPPTVASGEHFRFNRVDPQIVSGTLHDGEVNVDPEPINAGGFRFDFNVPFSLSKIVILHDGRRLFWHPWEMFDLGRPTETVTLMATAGQELRFDTEYMIKIYIQTLACQGFHFEIRFRTKPKP